MADPIFIDTALETIQADSKAAYESAAGKTLQPAHPEQLILNTMNYRELLLREGIQEASMQNLVDFSVAPILDYLGKLVGVERLQPFFAQTTLDFTLVAGHAAGTIPSGTRVQSVDGKVVFSLISDINVETGDTVLSGIAEAEIAGVEGNGYAIGDISTLLDTNPLIDTVENSDITSGGTDAETDDQLRDRIKLAPNAFSVAGSRGSYEFWAKSADPAIIDVYIDQPTPGTVKVWVLTAYPDTVTPTPVLNAVEAVLTDEKVRPMCDTVIVAAASKIDYDIEINVTRYTTAVSADTQAAIEANLVEFSQEKRRKLGLNITDTQIIAAAMAGLIDSVYDIEMVSWTDLTIGAHEFAHIGTITVNMVGTNDG